MKYRLHADTSIMEIYSNPEIDKGKQYIKDHYYQDGWSNPSFDYVTIDGEGPFEVPAGSEGFWLHFDPEDYTIIAYHFGKEYTYEITSGKDPEYEF